MPITLIAILAVSLSLHLPKVDTGDFKGKLKRVDFGGAISLILTVFFLLFGLDRGGNIAWDDHYTVGSLVAFGVCFVIFAFIEMELAAEPFAPRRIIVNRSLIASYLVNFFGIASAFTMLFHLSLYFQAVKGQSATQASVWLILSVVGGLSGSLSGGLIMQATGKFYVLTVLGYAALFVGSIIVTLTSGVLLTTNIGIIVGKHLFFLQVLCLMTVLGLGIVLSSIGNGDIRFNNLR